MTAITFSTAPRSIAGALKFHRFLGALREAIDEFAVYRLQRAVPEHELRRADGEIDRYRRLMQAQSNATPNA